MDLILENMQPEQVQVFKKMAKLLSIRTKIKHRILTEEQEDKALFIAMEEGLKSKTLTEKEKDSFLNSLGK
jgi:hypothetical protein